MGFTNILMLLGGLGAFLFGMKYMGDGLELAAGPKMNNLMEKLTRNPFFGFLLGVLVTAVIQSSSATTVMVMGFINAGIMDLAQATGVIIGANIGTTVTSVLIALDINAIAPACIFIGAALNLYGRKQPQKHLGQVILGFGILFQGLHTMSSAMGALKDLEAFQKFITTATNPFLGVLVGILICGIIQSSSASVGVLQALALQGLMPIHFASYLICGINIGSSMPPFLSAINAKNNAKRAAWIYFIYNAFGALLFIPITMFTPFTSWIAGLTSNAVVQVSICHIIFKVVTAFVLLPFTNLIVKLSFRFVPRREYENEHRLLYIDKNLSSSPGIMLLQIHKEIERMGSVVRSIFVMTMDGLLYNNIENKQKILDQENLLDFLAQSITDYLITFNKLELSKEESEAMGSFFHVINSLDRIGDHSIALLEKLEKTESFPENGLIYSIRAREEIRTIYEKNLQILDDAMNDFTHHQLSLAEEKELYQLKKSVVSLTICAQNNHIERMCKDECPTEAGIIFAKALQDLERIGDYAYNISGVAKPENQALGAI